MTVILSSEAISAISTMIVEKEAAQIPRLKLVDVNAYLQQTYDKASLDRAYTILFTDQRKSIQDFVNRLFVTSLNPTETIDGQDAKYLADVVKRVYNKVL